VTDALNPAMAWDRLAPPERAGDPGQRARLKVAPLRRLAVDELSVVDDDLPQADGATLFWLHGAPGAWQAWAAQIEGSRAVPWLVMAKRLRLGGPDASLVRWLNAINEIGGAPSVFPVEGDPRPLEPMPRALACICREQSAEVVYRSMEAGWQTVEEVKRRTGSAFGECQGRRCVPVIAARLDQAPGDRGSAITPRPPLVPVPASVLAAFVDA
jgi:hypothetical protein